MSKDQELLDLIQAFGPISTERVADRLGITLTQARSRVQRLRQAREIFNTHEHTGATYAAVKKDGAVLVQSGRISVMDQPTYTCPELHDSPTRPEAADALEIPSRVGNWRIYRDGRRERCV